MKIYVIILTVLLSACASTGIQSNGQQLERILKNTKPKSLERENQLSKLCLNNSSSMACWLLKPKNYSLSRLSIVQGPSHSGVAQFSVMALSQQQLSYSVIDPETGHNYHIKDLETVTNDNSSWKVDQLRFEGLEHNKELRLLVFNQYGQMLDIRSFKVADQKKQQPKIVLVSNLDDHYIGEQKKAWKQIYSKKPDYVFVLGGGVLTTELNKIPVKATTPDLIWHRYTETRLALDSFYQQELIPVIALWGEEDYGAIGQGKDFEYKTESLKIFKAFYPQQEIKGHFYTGPGNSYFLNFAENNFFFMDARSFRSKDSAYNKNQSHFGEDQLEWVEEIAKKSQQHTWFLSSSGFFSNYHPWPTLRRSHPLSYKKFLNVISKIKTPVVFASSSRKLFEVSNVELPELHAKTYEITTGALHGVLETSHWTRYPNSAQVVGKEKIHHFIEIELNKDTSFELKMSSVEKNGQPLYKKVLKVDLTQKQDSSQQAKR